MNFDTKLTLPPQSKKYFPMSIIGPVTENLPPSFVAFRHTPALDGVRGIAIIVVMIFHLEWIINAIGPYVKGGFLGVDIFFVLSGFLITSILLVEYERTSMLSLKNFYVRRSLRLMPALWLFIICFYIFGPHMLPGFNEKVQEGPYDFVYALTYTMNWVSATDSVTNLNLNHTWSLSIEEQFYILWSLILFKSFSEKRSRKTIFFLTVGLIMALGISRAVRAALGSNTRILYYSTDTRIDSLLVGCATSMIFIWGLIPQKRLKTIWFKVLLWVSIIASVICVATFSHVDVALFIYGLPVFTLSNAVIIYWLVTTEGTLLHKLLENRFLGWIGKISYGLYLWHFFLYDYAKNTFADRFTQVFVGITMAFTISALSYYLLEQPFLRLKHLFDSKSTASGEFEIVTTAKL